jgi:hypothetical protein
MVGLIGLLAVAPQSTYAQRLAAAWPHPVPISSLGAPSSGEHPLALLPTNTEGGTRAREGAVIGAVALGFLGAVTGVGLCHFDDPCEHPAPFAIGGFLLGALAGAGIGNRVGGSLLEDLPRRLRR